MKRTATLTVDELIQRWVADPPESFIVAEEAAVIVAACPADELSRWLHVHAVDTVSRYLRRGAASSRGLARNRGGARAFDRWRKADDDARESLPSPLSLRYCVNEDNEWKALRDMDRDEVLFVAQDRDARSRAMAMEAALMCAIAKRLDPGQRVGDAWSDDDLSELMPD